MSDYELIILVQKALEEPFIRGISGEITGWQIEALQANKDILKLATAVQASETTGCLSLSD